MLLIGPPGSGKSRRIMEEVRDRLRRRDFRFRLLVPTSTMAEHVRHSLAREGFVFRPELVSTLAGFVNTLEPPLQPLSTVRLRSLIRRSVAGLRPHAFEALAATPGLLSALAATMEELSAAGLEPERLRSALETSRGAIPRAFAEVYADVAVRAEAEGFGFWNRRLGLAEARVREQGIPGVEAVYLDGFFTFTDPELGFLEALACRTALTVTLADWPGARPAWLRLCLSGHAEERLEGCRRRPEALVVEAETQEREAGEIALRILELARAGVQFREIGIIVRQHEPYVPQLVSTLSRFGIPVRAYFSKRLADHPVALFYRAVVEAALNGWDHERTLAALNLTPSGLPAAAEYRKFAHRVRERLPGLGLADLRLLAGGGVVGRKLEELSVLERWPLETAVPREWARRFCSLRGLVAFPDPATQSGFMDALACREMAAACDAFEACMEEAASLLPSLPVDLRGFWEEAEQALRATPLPPQDRRRNVVHVLEVHEARQWELSTVFVCGLLERQFPLHHPQNAFLDDEIRRSLQREGFRLATAEERDQEEEFLFGFSLTRATEGLILSYPKFNAKGDPTLRSFLLDRYLEEHPQTPVVPARAVRPAPVGSRGPEARPNIVSEELRDRLASGHRETSPTALEQFLQCPFLFFAGQTLRLEEAPPSPEERLEFTLQGWIVHKVLERCLHHPEQFDAVFEEVFSGACSTDRIPTSYRTEAVRTALARDLRRFTRAMRLAEAEPEQVEHGCTLTLGGGVKLNCKLDRIDRLPDGSELIIDYKYSAKNKIDDYVREFRRKAGRLVHIQSGLYMAALEESGRRCGGFLFAAVRESFASAEGNEVWAGWRVTDQAGKGVQACSREGLREVMQRSVEAAMGAVERLRSGVIAPDPADADQCQSCRYRLICRVESAARAVAAGGVSDE